MSHQHEIDNQSILYVDVVEEMKTSFMDYAMSVIVGRALPDVRDGLKPVQRRILYAVQKLGFTHEKQHRKSATIVGEVIGKYHPHGDSSIYNAMVRLAQDFSLRYMLIDGHGNFGSIDGDGPAAMRYTEARMAKLTAELLRDIDKETVVFSPNFDETEKEPTVLPGRFPNLLVNGANGIAVGMATSIPPHNLSEVIDAVVYLIDHEDADVLDLMEFVKAPDFPTGAEIIGISGVRNAYRTGKGRVVMRSVCNIEEMKNGKSQIIVTEIPYQVNKAKLVEDIAHLVKDKRIDGIVGLRDESNRNGIRIVIELRRDVSAYIILNQLYKMSSLQTSMGIIMLALDDGQPKIMNLKYMLQTYLNHQEEVETRRVQFDLKKTKQRIHILEGLRIAIDNIDEVIRIIRSSYSEAEKHLMEVFSLSEIQAKAIVEMRLKRLQGIERENIEQEYKELMQLAEELQAILNDRTLLMDIIRNNLITIKEKFGDERRTKISFDESDIDIEDLIEEDEVIITVTNAGYVKRISTSEYASQNRGGKGKSGLSTKKEDFINEIYTTSTHDTLLFFTSLGRVYKLKAYQIPEASRISKGTSIVNLIPIQKEEKIVAILPVKNFEAGYIALCTKNGKIKKTNVKSYEKVYRKGKIAINILDHDELISARKTSGDSELFIVTSEGKSIRFSEKDIRATGNNVMGVRAINLSENDAVVAMDLYSENGYLLTMTEHGYGKKTDMQEYRLQTRGGKGILTYNISEKTGKLVAARNVTDADHLMIINSDGIMIRVRVCEINSLSRNTKGVIVMRMNEHSQVVSVAKIIDADEEEPIKEEEE